MEGVWDHDRSGDGGVDDVDTFGESGRHAVCLEMTVIAKEGLGIQIVLRGF